MIDQRGWPDELARYMHGLLGMAAMGPFPDHGTINQWRDRMSAVLDVVGAARRLGPYPMYLSGMQELRDAIAALDALEDNLE